MKKILGLDLGTNSIGWAVVNEKENDQEKSSIVKLGVRVNPLTVDELNNFESGKSITTNADRTLKRSMRRNLQRFKLRRENLISILRQNTILTNDSVLTDSGNASTFQTYHLRAKAVTEEISLEDLARVLLMINKKRGYKSSRKVNSDEDGQLIDGMTVATKLYETGMTPGEYVFSSMKKGNFYIPDFYRSDLKEELDRVWKFQHQFYPEILTDDLKESIQGKNKSQTWAICAKPFGIEGIKRTSKGEELKKENFSWRVKSLSEQMGMEQLAIVIQEVNGSISSSSGYLGAISDRSKELYFDKQTVGQYWMSKLAKNPNYSLRNEVFYRQDYLDEFEKIWETQARYHKELTPELKKLIRDVVIFYQRPLKSKKGLISFCELESRQIEITVDGKKKLKTVGSRVCPKSSPIFQEFKIWQRLNDVTVKGSVVPSNQMNLFGESQMVNGERSLTEEEKEILFVELSFRDKLKKADALKLLFTNYRELNMNFEELEGNRTQTALFKAYESIIEMTGHDALDFNKIKSSEIYEAVYDIFSELGFKTDFLKFDSSLDGDKFEQQPMYALWHLLYSFEGDNTKTGNEKLISKIQSLCGLNKEYAAIIAKVTFQDDYGNLSTKAMRKILPFMREGNKYSIACAYAGYNHSQRSLTSEQLNNKVLKGHLEILPKNSLRNPVVEKILNQMINVVNDIIDSYGKPDEIRVEMARSLKSSAKEREEAIKAISKNTTDNQLLREEIVKEFGKTNVSRNDIIRYKLYKELKANGYYTLYSNQYIRQEDVFSNKVDIEHIIPQAKVFDDSFSNKTLEYKSINIEKGNSTAYDFVKQKYGESRLDDYVARVEKLYKDKVIGKAKYKKLLMAGNDIPSGFIDRDLRNSQYIAKQAIEILESLVKFVVPTVGSITDRLRDDWQLVDVMQELDWAKYDKLGLTEVIHSIDYDGHPYNINRIKDWTKRNDQRHHAMDALTIAFTKRSIIQYLNNLNARVGRDYLRDGLMSVEAKQRSGVIYAIEDKELYRDKNNNLRFNPPIPLNDFRAEAKRQLENVLVSYKSKNKVVTNNVNVTKTKTGVLKKMQRTPRGQLHLETLYGSNTQYVTKLEKVGSSFDLTKIVTVANKREREALLVRLEKFGNDPKKAFTGKNALSKNPIYLDEAHSYQMAPSVKTVTLEQCFTIRKQITPDLKIDKVVDCGIRTILQQRLDSYKGDAKAAFSNLEDNPIWLNKDKNISIKTVTIRGISNAIALHDKRDQYGHPILDSEGHKIPCDFVNTGNNHHVAIYRDAEGNLQQNVVSFFEATSRAMDGLPVVDVDYKKSEGWQFLFTMKQNDYFVFPRYESSKDENDVECKRMVFDPKEIDLMNPDNYAAISPNLFRVQKLASYDYVFRHHLETTVEEKNELRAIAWKRVQTAQALSGIVKVRINHIGQIVHIGE